MLTKAKFDRNPNLCDYSVSKCNRGNCGTCPFILENSSVKFKNRSERFFVHSNIDCAARNVIYVIICQGCFGEYIGQTECLRDRVRVHKQQIKDPNTRCIPLSAHLDTCAKNKDIKFKIFPFYKMDSNDKIMRRIKEEYFIKMLKPELNASN